MTEFILCYKDDYQMNWSCECGFKTVSELQVRAEQLTEKDENMCVKFFPTSQRTPKFVKKLSVKYYLTPNINWIEKDITEPSSQLPCDP